MLGGKGEFADHHGVADGGQPERVAETHQAAAGGEISRHQDGRRPALRRSQKKGVRRSHRDPQRQSEGEADHGDLLARRSRRRRGGQASGRNDVKVIGLGLPNDNKRYVHEGITDGVVLWNTMDLGYLTIHAAKAVGDGTLNPAQHR